MDPAHLERDEEKENAPHGGVHLALEGSEREELGPAERDGKGARAGTEVEWKDRADDGDDVKTAAQNEKAADGKEAALQEGRECVVEDVARGEAWDMETRLEGNAFHAAMVMESDTLVTETVSCEDLRRSSEPRGGNSSEEYDEAAWQREQELHVKNAPPPTGGRRRKTSNAEHDTGAATEKASDAEPRHGCSERVLDLVRQSDALLRRERISISDAVHVPKKTMTETLKLMEQRRRARRKPSTGHRRLRSIAATVGVPKLSWDEDYRSRLRRDSQTTTDGAAAAAADHPADAGDDDDEDEDDLVVLPPIQRPNSISLRREMTRELLGECLRRRAESQNSSALEASPPCPKEEEEDLLVPAGDADEPDENITDVSALPGPKDNAEETEKEAPAADRERPMDADAAASGASESSESSAGVERTYASGRARGADAMEDERPRPEEEEEVATTQERRQADGAPNILIDDEASEDDAPGSGSKSSTGSDSDDDGDGQAGEVADLICDQEEEDVVGERSLYRAFEQRERRRREERGGGEGERNPGAHGRGIETRQGPCVVVRDEGRALRSRGAAAAVGAPLQQAAAADADDGADDDREGSAESRSRAKALWKAERKRRSQVLGAEIRFCNLDADSEQTWERLQKSQHRAELVPKRKTAKFTDLGTSPLRARRQGPSLSAWSSQPVMTSLSEVDLDREVTRGFSNSAPPAFFAVVSSSTQGNENAASVAREEREPKRKQSAPPAASFASLFASLNKRCVQG